MTSRAQDLVDMHEMIIDKYQELFVSMIEKDITLIGIQDTVNDSDRGAYRVYDFEDGSSLEISGDGDVEAVTRGGY